MIMDKLFANDRKKKFLTELASLMERYGAEFEVIEECKDYYGSYVGSIDVNFTGGGYISIPGSYIDTDKIKRVIEVDNENVDDRPPKVM